jgi:hypothetical protein
MQEEDRMYRPYRDFPRIDEPILMLAKFHLQELNRELAAACLARSVQEGRTAPLARLFAQARRTWHGLWVRIRKSAQVTETRAGGWRRPAGIE